MLGWSDSVGWVGRCLEHGRFVDKGGVCDPRRPGVECKYGWIFRDG